MRRAGSRGVGPGSGEAAGLRIADVAAVWEAPGSGWMGPAVKKFSLSGTFRLFFFGSHASLVP
jgi:hypothetical protein